MIGWKVSRDKKLIKRRVCFVCSQHLPLLIDMGAEYGNNAESITKPTICTLGFFCTSMLFADRIIFYKGAKTHKEEARMVLKTVAMPSWDAWPARNCITVAFALEKAKFNSLQLLFLDGYVWP